MIQSVPTSSMNRDRDGKPKTIVFGGYKRIRLSSQSQKRAAREYTHKHNLLDDTQRAYRSRMFAQKAIELLMSRGVEEAAASVLVTKALAAIGMKLDKLGQNQYLIFHGTRELVGFGDAILEHREIIESANLETEDQTEKQSKKRDQRAFPVAVREALEKPFTTEKVLEVAMYGRQLADLPDGTVDGQIQVMHAFSVHATLDETDFFTAVDDYLPSAKTGGGFLGDLGIGAPTFYRMAAINIDQIAEEVGSQEAALLGVKAFIEAFVYSLPGGGKNAFSQATVPNFVMLQRIDQGQAFNLAPAFEQPLITPPSRSMSSTAVEMLEKYHQNIERMYPRLQGRKRVCINATQHQVKFATVVANLNEAIAAILE
jgi:CRISPR system Cascade subunit CasC